MSSPGALQNASAIGGEEPADLDALLGLIRQCQVCAPTLPHEPQPIIRARESARILIIGQAPGVRAHKANKPFADPSGDRLRRWLGIDEDVFYNDALIAISPMGYCFPGLNEKGGDLPPRKECAPLWQAQVKERLPHLRLTVLIGQYAQKFHLGPLAKGSLTETVRSWRDYAPDIIVTPHPSWRNNAWLKRNPWFSAEVEPELKSLVSRAIMSASLKSR